MMKKKKKNEPIVELTDEQIKQEEEFLKGIPRFDLAALFGAPIWGPIHGFWSCILFYPLWLLADNFFVNVAQAPSFLAIVLAVLVVAILITAHFVFMRVSVPIAWHRAYDKGVTKEAFIKRQRMWAIASVIMAVAAVILATYYHLVMEPVFIA